MSRSVRVCFVIDRLMRGGTETQLLKLIEGLKDTRVRPYLCLLDGEDDLSRSLEPNSCPVLRLGVRSLHHPSTLWRAWYFVRFLRRERIDIVQTHFPDSTYFAVPIAKMAGVRHILRTRRDLGFWMRPVDRWLGRICSRFVTATIANCEACRQAVIAQEGASPGSVAVMSNGIDLKPLLSIPPVSSVANGQPRRVGMVANLRPVKGPEVFIHAASLLAHAHPAVRFEIAGGGDPAAACRLAETLGIADRLLFSRQGTRSFKPALLAYWSDTSSC